MLNGSGDELHSTLNIEHSPFNIWCLLARAAESKNVRNIMRRRRYEARIGEQG